MLNTIVSPIEKCNTTEIIEEQREKSNKNSGDNNTSFFDNSTKIDSSNSKYRSINKSAEPFDLETPRWNDDNLKNVN